MTVNALELSLHDLGTKKEARSAFAADSPSFLRRYRLDPDEAAMLATFDIAGLQRRGVSALLTYGFWMMNEPSKSRSAYLARLNAPSV